MSLFINNDKHHNIFKNMEDIKDTNQSYFRRDHLSELLKEQQKINDSLYRSILGLKRVNKQQNSRQDAQWMEMNFQLNELKGLHEKHDKTGNQVVQKLLNLEAGNWELLQLLNNKQLSEREWIDQMNSIRQSNNEMMNQFKQYAATTEQIELKVNEQTTSQKQMNEQISKQAQTQTDVIKRLENQEAISEKLLRQIDHFRSILFERTTYLAEKIESGYQLTATYMTQLMTGSDIPIIPNVVHMKEKKQKEDVN